LRSVGSSSGGRCIAFAQVKAGAKAMHHTASSLLREEAKKQRKLNKIITASILNDFKLIIILDFSF